MLHRHTYISIYINIIYLYIYMYVYIHTAWNDTLDLYWFIYSTYCVCTYICTGSHLRYHWDKGSSCRKWEDAVVFIVAPPNYDRNHPPMWCHQHVIRTSPDAPLRRVVIIGRNVLLGQAERMRYQVMRLFSGCQKMLIPPIHSTIWPF